MTSPIIIRFDRVGLQLCFKTGKKKTNLTGLSDGVCVLCVYVGRIAAAASSVTATITRQRSQNKCLRSADAEQAATCDYVTVYIYITIRYITLISRYFFVIL